MSDAEPTTTPAPGWLTRNLAVLSGVSLLQDAASEMLYPVLPLFLTQVLGAPAAVVGLVEGLAEGIAAVAKVVTGRLADRRRRRPLIGAGYGLAAVAKTLIALATVWPVVLAGRCIDRLGKGIRGAPRDALLVSGIRPENRGAAFGFHRMADTLGAVIGPATGLAIFELLGRPQDSRMRILFVIAVVPAVLSVALILAVRESTAPSRPQSSAEGDEPLPAQFWTVLVLLTGFSVLNFPDALLLLRAHSLGLDDAAVIAAYILYNIAYAALSFPAGRLADAVPARIVFAAGLGFFAAGYIGLGVVRSPALVFVVLAVYGGFQACTDGVGKAWISRLAPPTRQGTAQGLFQGLSGAAVLSAGIWAGLAWGGDGAVPVLISGCGALVVAAILLAAGRRLDPAAAA